jgi:hypothetical protein
VLQPSQVRDKLVSLNLDPAKELPSNLQRALKIKLENRFKLFKAQE